MTIVIPNPAMDITASDHETFDACAERIRKATQKRLRYKDIENPDNKEGIPIEIDPALHYSFLMLGLSRLGTPEEFMLLFGTIMTVINQLESAGQLPEGWVKSVATPFNVKCPAIPETFDDSIAGEIIKAYFIGTGEVNLSRQIPVPEVEGE